jgi:hypothetical protein
VLDVIDPFTSAGVDLDARALGRAMTDIVMIWFAAETGARCARSMHDGDRDEARTGDAVGVPDLARHVLIGLSATTSPARPE